MTAMDSLLRSTGYLDREEVSRLMKSPAVAVTLIIVGGVLGLGLLGVFGFLVYVQRDTSSILNLVNLLLTSGALAKVYSVSAKTDRIEKNTNGAQTRLLDHALGQQPTSRDE